MENIPEKFLKPYNPAETEGRIYKLWEDSGFFNPDVCIEKEVTDANAETFSMVLPPPNVTGNLHTGHALTMTVEDAMVRFARMRGKRTLWVPGTDHAAIATQSKVERIIEKEEGKRRSDLGREEFLNRVNKFAQESHDTIINQSKSMGSSLDWSREAFTLDDKRQNAVYAAFKKMYDDGLIYRGYKVINWDPKGQTTISDDEIVYEERKAKLYTFKYSKDFPISISTTRPETKVGDTAVAVHPDDSRYSEFVGKEYDAVFCGVPIHIKIIADEGVEKDFGTGALGVTPAHSMIDADMAKKHGLPMIQVIDERAKMMVSGENLKGKKVTEAREVIVDWLKSEGLLEKEEETTQNVATAERTSGIIEPLPKMQWFIDVNKKIDDRGGKSLKELMQNSVADGEIKIIPDYFGKTYFNWINNLRDWCISRQIWYGHRIPVWYKGEEIQIGTPPNGDGWTQDEDTLDTWFSSGLWTFSTLGWPENTDDLKNYHPTTMLETGYDILFFWVARMILMSTYLLGEVPFKNVYLHGLVRTQDGKKMSKSLGNAMDPVMLIEKYGADALRMSLVVGTAAGTDSKLSEDKIKGYKHFGNKLWNIARFILSIDATLGSINDADSKVRAEFDAVLKDLTADLDEYRFHLASEKLYHYIWHNFADTILEESKVVFKDGTAEEKNSRYALLVSIFKDSLKALHPFMPFVTEEIWGLMGEKQFLMVTKWPS